MNIFFDIVAVESIVCLMAGDGSAFSSKCTFLFISLVWLLIKKDYTLIYHLSIVDVSLTLPYHIHHSVEENNVLFSANNK